jgi:hypothetical protein
MKAGQGKQARGVFHDQRAGKETVMTSRTRRVLPAIAASAMFAGAGIASAAEPTQQELLAQLEQLKEKVATLEAKQLNSSDVDATVESVLRDADRRSQLLAVDGAGAGYDSRDGFHIKDATGANLLRIGFQFQYRNVTNYRDEEPLDFDNVEDDDDLQNGMEIRRFKTSFSGNAISTALKYVFTIAYGEDGIRLENAYVDYAMDEGWGIRVGQFKDVTYKEESTSSSRLMAVDRSLINEAIGGGITDYIQAVAAYFGDPDGVFVWVGLSDGASSANTNWLDEPSFRPDYGVFARADWTLMGQGRSGSDFTAMGTDEDYFGVGAGAHWSQAPEENTIFHSFDAHYETAGGLGLFGAYYGNWLDTDGAGEIYNWGVLGQISQMLNEDWEVFGQVGYMDLDISGDDTFWQLVAGVNWYMDGHTKVTVDVVVLPDGAPGSFSEIGLLASDDFQVAVRGQFQLVR